MITKLFPWSAEARIIEFHINNPDEFHTKEAVHHSARVHPRTVWDTSRKLVGMGILEETQEYRDKANRKRQAWKLNITELTVLLIRLEKELMKIETS